MKLKASLLTILLCAILGVTMAQESDVGLLSVAIVDGEQSALPLSGAVVEITKQGSTSDLLYYLADENGMVAIPNMDYGSYSLTISFMGYETRNINFTLSTSFLELPTISLVSTSVQMDEVVKEIRALRTSQNGDSLFYNASSYKVANDADVEGLLQKMPGITIEDGTVTAQGETITKIYIDGREFFGSDVATALKSLPAEVVDRIELFNKLSDEAEYTGMDDGNGSKTINIVTKPSMREGIFGKVFGGVGYEATPAEGGSTVKYMGGGSVNLFNGSSRTSVIGIINNLNQQNFTFEDIMGATEEGSSTGDFTIKALPGVANVNAVGINYSNEFGEKERVKLQGSYFFNQTRTDNTEQITRWYNELASTSVDSLHQTAYTRTYNTNHRFTGRIDYKINNRQSLMIRPTLSYQITEPQKVTSGTRYDTSNSKYDENGEQRYGSTKDSYWVGYNIGVAGNYRLQLGKSGRSLSLNFNSTFNRYTSQAETSTEPNDPNNNGSETTYTYENTPTFKRNLSGGVNYMEPLSKVTRLNFSYKVSNVFQSSDKRTYDTESDYEVEDLDDTKTTTFAQSSYTTHSTGVGLRFKVGKKGSVTSSIYYQNATFDVNTLRTKASNSSHDEVNTTKNYNNATYSVVANVAINSGNSLKFYLNSNTTAPPIWRFTDNTTSTSYVTAGNSDLEPSYSHKLRAYYTRTNSFEGNTFMFNCNAALTTQYIGTHIVLDPDPIDVAGTMYDNVQQYTGYLNLDNPYYKLDSNISYGMPLDFAKCNINFSAGLSYTSTPSVYGGEVVEMGVVDGGESVSTETITYKGGVSIGSNISENIDFTISWRGNYSSSTNVYAEATTENTYFNQTATAFAKFTLLGGFTLTTNITYKQYLGFTNTYDDRYILFNAFVGHKVMRNNRGEVIVGVNDILDQNMNISRSVASSYTQNKSNSTTGRYFSVQFIYNLRAFGLWGKNQ
ncbi:MAG: outer membrane beta-barrel protein [Rikenellaceae bacterium]